MFLEAQSEGYFSKVLADVSINNISKDSGPKSTTEKENSFFSSMFGNKGEKVLKTHESTSKTESIADYFSFIGGAITKYP